jgi:hypothetical protein
MLIEVGDYSDLGEAWVRYHGNRVIADYGELLHHAVRADPNGALASDREPQLIQFYELEPPDLDEGYLVGGCWVFRVCPTG